MEKKIESQYRGDLKVRFKTESRKVENNVTENYISNCPVYTQIVSSDKYWKWRTVDTLSTNAYYCRSEASVRATKMEPSQDVWIRKQATSLSPSPPPLFLPSWFFFFFFFQPNHSHAKCPMGTLLVLRLVLCIQMLNSELISTFSLTPNGTLKTLLTNLLWMVKQVAIANY